MNLLKAIHTIIGNNNQYESGGITIYWDKEKERVSLKDFINPRGIALEINQYLLNKDWKLLAKPVPFMEVVESEKLFRVEYRSINSFDDLGYCDLVEFFVYMEEEYEGSTIRDILLKGKFYIKED